MSKIREKEYLECVRMHIWASRTQKLPGPLSGPWTPAAECSLHSHDSASLRRQLSASEAGAPPLDQILDPHLLIYWVIKQSQKNLLKSIYNKLNLVIPNYCRIRINSSDTFYITTHAHNRLHQLPYIKRTHSY